MKSIITTSLFILFCLGTIFLLFGCKSKPLSLDMSVVEDFSEDSFIALPDKVLIKKFFPTKQEYWNGYSIYIVGITNIDLVPSYGAEINSDEWYSGDLNKRKKEIKRFDADIDNAFEKVNAIPKGYVQSSVYVPLARELIRLSQSHALRRVALVYSDLMEHSSLADFYQKSTLETMQNNPEVVWNLFQKKIALPDLTGIEIQIVYQPRDSEENNRFSIVSEFFQKMLESKGAKVAISANLVL